MQFARFVFRASAAQLRHAGDRKYECDYGFVGEAGKCVPYVAKEAPEMMEECGEIGEPVCKGVTSSAVLQTIMAT